MSKTTIDLGRHARALPIGTISEDNRTAEMVFSTGSPVRRFDFQRSFEFIETLSLDPKHVRLDRFRSGAPLLNNHWSTSIDDVLGVVEEASVDGAEGRARVRFDEGEEGEKAFQMVKRGTLRNVSVGYIVHRYEDVTDEDDQVRTLQAVDWEPVEVSIVPVPADPSAGFRSEGQSPITCEIINRAAAHNEEDLSMVDKAEAVETPALEKVDMRLEKETVNTSLTSKDVNDAVARGVQEERQRASEIRAAVRKAKLDDDFAQTMIDENKTVDQARSAIIDKLADGDIEIRTQTRVELGEDGREKFRAAVEHAIIERSGNKNLIKQSEGETVSGSEMRGYSMLSIARRSLEIAGERNLGTLNDNQLMQRAITQSTSDFPIILENTLNRVLRAAYDTTPDTWSQLCAIGSVTDFKPSHRLRLGSFGSLDSLTENGEYKYKAIPDALKETVQASTKGNMINISRQALINDDLGAFESLSRALGRAAKLSIEVDFYAMLAENSGLGPNMADGNPLFDAAHNNIAATGAGPTTASFDAIRQLMALQKDQSGNEILDLRPAIWLGPVGLGGEARVINGAEFDTDGTKHRKPNKSRGLFNNIIDTGRLTGTRWYALADPLATPTFEVVFLNGQQEPYTESREGWTVDGLETKVRLDYGVTAVDSVTAATNAGA